MQYIELDKISSKKFRRLTGVKKHTFLAIIKVLNTSSLEKQKKGGPKHRLSIEDRVLMFLEYLREYRTYAHIAQSRGISESACFRDICWIEDELIKCGIFSLPGRKALLDDSSSSDNILIDVTETPVQRPKKNKRSITQERRKDIH